MVYCYDNTMYKLIHLSKSTYVNRISFIIGCTIGKFQWFLIGLVWPQWSSTCWAPCAVPPRHTGSWWRRRAECGGTTRPVLRTTPSSGCPTPARPRGAIGLRSASFVDTNLICNVVTVIRDVGNILFCLLDRVYVGVEVVVAEWGSVWLYKFDGCGFDSYSR